MVGMAKAGAAFPVNTVAANGQTCADFARLPNLKPVATWQDDAPRMACRVATP